MMARPTRAEDNVRLVGQAGGRGQWVRAGGKGGRLEIGYCTGLSRKIETVFLSYELPCNKDLKIIFFLNILGNSH